MSGLVSARRWWQINLRRIKPVQFNQMMVLIFYLCVCVCFQEKSSGRTAHYKLTSTVMLWLQTNKTGSGTMNLGGSLTRQVERCSGQQYFQTCKTVLLFFCKSSRLLLFVTDGERRDGWRILATHRQHWTPCWSSWLLDHWNGVLTTICRNPVQL